jgi:DNA sulfur modification protein DndC
LAAVESERSAFDARPIGSIYDEVRNVYLADSRPWVIGYSGGKDSTATLQLVWIALSELPVEQRQKPIFVISSDTFVETPIIVDHVDTNLDAINRVAKEQGLPIEARKVVPETTDTFWVCLIGKGYPAPTSKFRWCTERMKIRPADRFILDKVAEFGEVVMVLGARKGESASRDQVLKSHEVRGSRCDDTPVFPMRTFMPQSTSFQQQMSGRTFCRFARPGESLAIDWSACIRTQPAGNAP